MITGRGILYLLILAGMGIGVAYSGLSQLYAIFLVLLLLPILSLLQVLRLRQLISVVGHDWINRWCNGWMMAACAWTSACRVLS